MPRTIPPTSFESYSRSFTWKIPANDWSEVANGDCIPLGFQTMLPPDNKKVKWTLKLFPRGTVVEKEHIAVALEADSSYFDMYEGDLQDPSFKIETAYQFRKPGETKPIDMYSCGSFGTFKSSECEYENNYDEMMTWGFLEEPYVVGSVDDRIENGFIVFKFEMRTYLTPKEKFQANVSKENKMFVDNLKAFYGDSSGDVKIICDGKEFFCHKLLLISQSPVFKAMFSQDSKENEDSCLVIEDSSPEAVQELLFYLYHARLRCEPFSSAELEVVFGLVHLTSKYQIELLMDSFKDTLLDMMNVDNVLKILVVVNKYPELKNIFEIVSKFMEENFVNIVDKGDWSDFIVANCQSSFGDSALLQHEG